MLSQKGVIRELVECLYSVLPQKQRADLDDSQRSDQLVSLRMPCDLPYHRLLSPWFVKIILPSEWSIFCRVFATPLRQKVLIPPTGLSAFILVYLDSQIFSCCISSGIIQLQFIIANVIKDQAHYPFTGGEKKKGRSAFWRIIWILRDVNNSNTLNPMKEQICFFIVP